MGLPGVNVLFCLSNVKVHIVSLLLAAFNTAKDFLDLVKYGGENFAPITFCVVIMIATRYVIVVSRIAQSISSAMISDC